MSVDLPTLTNMSSSTNMPSLRDLPTSTNMRFATNMPSLRDLSTSTNMRFATDISSLTGNAIKLRAKSSERATSIAQGSALCGEGNISLVR
ncbi:MAG: hypothetical protein LBK18_08000 [Prevotellaceae bacterium]|nr:hypothetical protein [Prevotellaceae bacterium]